MEPVVRFNIMKVAIDKIEEWTFSAASFNIISLRDYGQTGTITGLPSKREPSDNNFHVIAWISAKQGRVSHSSYGAEILTSAYTYDRSFFIRDALWSILRNKKI